MHSRIPSRGFTLIELLVVIALIGVLSAVILAALNTARSKGSDGAIKSDFAIIPNQAELFSTGNGNSFDSGAAISSSGTSCEGLTTAGTIFSDTAIDSALKQIGSYNSDSLDCGVASQAWSFAGALITSGSGWWCIDSTGVARNKTVTGTAYTALTGSTGAAHTATGATSCN